MAQLMICCSKRMHIISCDLRTQLYELYKIQMISKVTEQLGHNVVCPPVNQPRFQCIQSLAGPKGQQQIEELKIIVD